MLNSQKGGVLVIRHEACSGLGLLQTALHRHSIPFHYLDTPTGEQLSGAITDYSHLVILGGPISAYEDDKYPFLRYEFQLVESAIENQIPTLGICLGSQILAKVLGAKVYRGEAGREAGWCKLELTEAGLSDSLFQDLPSQFRVFESHQDTFEIPSSCVHLAKSAKYPHQAFRYQEYVWAIQFHLEIDHKVLANCAAVIEQELEESQIYDTTLEQLLEEAKYHAPTVAPLADAFMQRFLETQPKALVVG